MRAKPQTWMAFFDSALFAILVGALLYRAVPDQNRELVSAAAGFLAGWIGAARNFYWGSTTGSEAKNEAINHLARRSTDSMDVQADVVNVEEKK